MALPVDQLPRSVVAFAPSGREKVQELITALDPEGATFNTMMEAWVATLPTSAAGLDEGAVWKNSNVLTVVPAG